MPDGFFVAESSRSLATPLREVPPLSDDPEVRRWERYKVFFAQRERQAHTVLKTLRALEAMSFDMNQPLTHARLDQLIIEVEQQVGSELQSASPEMRAAFKHAVTNWAAHSRKAEQVMRALTPDAPKELHEWTYTDTAEVGYEIFKQCIGEEPKGSVRFLCKGPFFHLSFLDDKDYHRFKALFSTTGESFEGAVFLSGAVWPRRSLMVPTILQKGDEVDLSLLAHESQHFVNHSLGMVFTNWEQGADTHSSPESRQRPLANMHRGLKDELIAYLRDGKNPLDIEKLLAKGGNYNKLYTIDGVSQEEIQKTEIILKDVCQALQNHIWLKQNDSRHDTYLRELMVATLVDIPLRKMEGYIRYSHQYYQEKKEAIDIAPARSKFSSDAAGELSWQEAVNAHRRNQYLALGFSQEYLNQEQERPTSFASLEKGRTVAWNEEDKPSIKKARKIADAVYVADQAWKNQPAQRRRIDQE